MLSIDLIRHHPEIVREALRRRQDSQNLDELLHLLSQRRTFVTRCDGLYASLKQRKDSRPLAATQQIEASRQVKATNHDIRQLKLQIADLDTHIQPLLLNLPNIPHESVQDGACESDEGEIRRWGEPLPFHFEPRAHWELGERLHLLDFQAGTVLAGSRFSLLKGNGARLERALISFMLDVHTREHGYTEIMPPYLVKRSIMVASGQLPKFEDQVYSCLEDELYLNPTAEVPLVGIHSNSILLPDALPLRYVAWTTAFRREAGSASRQTRGLLRLHQFNKVELFLIVEPQESYNAFNELIVDAEAILQQLELPYRVVDLCAADLPFASAKTVDLEVWMASQNCYIEVSSISNCEAFQAHRANIKYRPSPASSAEYVHTLNASGLAVGRTMAALLETYQQADGTVIVPKVLRPYMGTSLLTP